MGHDMREEGVGFGKRPARAAGEPMVMPMTPLEPLVGVASIGPASLEDRLFLALRTCATHPAGPLRVVSDMEATSYRDDEELRAMVKRVRVRFAQMDMPDDRRGTGDAFLDVLERAFS